MKISFTKMQGLGNDFILINALEQNIALTPAHIRQMADRHFGIGFDQLLLVTPPPHAGVDFGYKIYNADGSAAEQCGNGARCFARFVYENKLTTKQKLRIAAPTGNIDLEIKENHQVSVNMGLPLFEPAQIPFKTAVMATKYSLYVGTESLQLGVVSMGNPHAVLAVDNIEAAPVATLGPLLMAHPDFPEQVNVGFMQMLDPKHIRLRVYERGAGETLACGSGACAAVVVGRLQGLLAEEVRVQLPGGELAIHWQGKGFPVWMAGPAEFVFTGIWGN